MNVLLEGIDNGGKRSRVWVNFARQQSCLNDGRNISPRALQSQVDGPVAIPCASRRTGFSREGALLDCSGIQTNTTAGDVYLSAGCLTPHPALRKRIIRRKFHDFCYIVTPCVSVAWRRVIATPESGRKGNDYSVIRALELQCGLIWMMRALHRRAYRGFSRRLFNRHVFHG